VWEGQGIYIEFRWEFDLKMSTWKTEVPDNIMVDLRQTNCEDRIKLLALDISGVETSGSSDRSAGMWDTLKCIV
jgi:hypothetical protein